MEMMIILKNYQQEYFFNINNHYKLWLIVLVLIGTFLGRAVYHILILLQITETYSSDLSDSIVFL